MDTSQPDPRDYSSGRGYLTQTAPLPAPSEQITAPRPPAVPPGSRPGQLIQRREYERLDLSEDLQGDAPWLGSLVVHMILLIFLGLIVVSIKKASDEKPIEATFGEGPEGSQLLENNLGGLSTDTPDPTV